MSRAAERLQDKLVEMTGIFPDRLFIQIARKVGDNPVAGGGFADVWRGLIESKNIRVAMKALRIFGVDGETKKEIERVCFTSTEAVSSSNNFDI